MKTHIHEITRLEKMIFACHLEEAVSDEFKRFQKRRKQALYKRILVRLGIYSFVTGMLVSLFFIMKKSSALIGMKFFITSVFIAASATSLVVYKVMEKPTGVILQETVDVQQDIAPVPVQKEPAAISHFTLGLQAFRTESVDASTLNLVNRYMLQSLKSVRGGSYAALLPDVGEEKVNYIVNQTIEKMDESYYIQVKIIDKNTSAIILAVKGTADSEQKLKDLCDTIARQVISAVK
jgi:hypothetical protein